MQVFLAVCVYPDAYVSIYNARVAPLSVEFPASTRKMVNDDCSTCSLHKQASGQWPEPVLHCLHHVCVWSTNFAAHKLQQQGRCSPRITSLVYLEFMSFAFLLHKAIFWWTIFPLAAFYMHSPSRMTLTSPRTSTIPHSWCAVIGCAARKCVFGMKNGNNYFMCNILVVTKLHSI